MMDSSIAMSQMNVFNHSFDLFSTRYIDDKDHSPQGTIGLDDIEQSLPSVPGQCNMPCHGSIVIVTNNSDSAYCVAFSSCSREVKPHLWHLFWASAGSSL